MTEIELLRDLEKAAAAMIVRWDKEGMANVSELRTFTHALSAYRARAPSPPPSVDWAHAAAEMTEVLDGTTGAFLAVLLERMATNLEMLGTSADNDLVVEARSRAVKIRAILTRIRGGQA